MRKGLLAVAAAAFAVGTPAAAQYYAQPYGYGYNGYRYNSWSRAQNLHRRIYNVLRALDGLPPDQAYRISAEANMLDRQLQMAASNGLNPYEAHELDVRIGQLERWRGRAAARGQYGYSRYNGYDGYYGYRGGPSRGDYRSEDNDDD